MSDYLFTSIKILLRIEDTVLYDDEIRLIISSGIIKLVQNGVTFEFAICDETTPNVELIIEYLSKFTTLRFEQDISSTIKNDLKEMLNESMWDLKLLYGG